MEEEKKDHEPVACPICGEFVKPKWEPKYNGPRAACEDCGINWAES